MERMDSKDFVVTVDNDATVDWARPRDRNSWNSLLTGRYRLAT